MSALLQTPLFWAALTIAAFIAGQQLYRRTGNNAFLPPILTGIVLVSTTLELSGISYTTYMEGGRFLHLMLGPVVVMLAVPLYQFIHTMRKQWLRIALAVTIGSGVTVACAVVLAHFWIGDDAITRTIYTKSITTPVAVAISEQVGGISALASAFVIITGILGALMIPPMLKATRMDDPQTLGLTLGICAHAIGTSRALELGPQQSAYAAMAMTLTATLHALVLPWLV
ncbi:LrgB family protein [Thalassolituus marinus]|uniref:LrgB family protein n=1 Tax=Thalassolituus marinus TaxID=671053 RepID=A0ABS7ZPW5_9GAMM|nr:LrgB family protein [Thalassolituus marinus]MCA6063233.1 LrgB family protein [Thalassolituus marinus]